MNKLWCGIGSMVGGGAATPVVASSVTNPNEGVVFIIQLISMVMGTLLSLWGIHEKRKENKKQ